MQSATEGRRGSKNEDKNNPTQKVQHGVKGAGWKKGIKNARLPPQGVSEQGVNRISSFVSVAVLRSSRPRAVEMKTGDD